MSLRRGTLLLVSSWVAIILVQYLLNVWLARTLAPEQYGIYGLVMSFLTWMQIFVINGLPYTAQKFISEDEKRAFDILHTSLRIQAGIALVLTLAGLALAPSIAAALRDIRLARFFRIAFLDLLFVGFFHLYVSFQNGLRHYGRQALLMVVWVLLKTVMIIFFMTLFKTLATAFFANAAASLFAFIAAYTFTGRGHAAAPYESKKLIHFMIPSILYFSMITFLFSVDLWSVKYYLGNEWSGYYVAASLIARVPYYIFLGLSAAVLPVVSGGMASGSVETIRSTIHHSTRFLTVLAFPICIVFTFFSREIAVLLYSPLYAESGPILAILTWGLTLLAFFSLYTTVINASNRPYVSFLMAFICVLLEAVLNTFLIPALGARGAAIGTTSAIGMGCAMALWWVWKKYRRLMHAVSFIRFAASGAGMCAALLLLKRTGVSFIASSIVSMAFYVLLLYTTRELTVKEVLGTLKSMTKLAGRNE